MGKGQNYAAAVKSEVTVNMDSVSLRLEMLVNYPGCLKSVPSAVSYALDLQRN